MFAQDAPTLFGQPNFSTPPIVPKPKGGMFGGGGKFGIKEALAFGLAGLVSRQNPGMLQALMGMMAQKQRAAHEEEQYQRHRGDELADYEAKKGIDARFPNAVNNDTVNDFNFIRSQLGEDAAKQYLRNLGDPMVTTQLPGNRVYSGPRSQLGAALGSSTPSLQPGHVEEGFRFKGGNPADPNAWEPVNGGPTPQASGGFPSSGY